MRSQHDGMVTPLIGEDIAATHQHLLLQQAPACWVVTSE